ncbi:cell division protein FtsX [Hallella multisaccharivorax DSM 17128]|uniref:Cell division protein FtsX n=1 Tax=Hallella multisaccharivorax DSM 17128 TaxID=688246 RepID=F8N9P8_9BACT|nr:permease-like cell division protein FtsX [Hallella multisaccharivorax]EGN56690.1 cell division protein FtsX [Hallella multisaccharivorax DSM 17128]GJG30227.1 cell division protein FtsX [Hallella multisaccharivorax DSM 17128]
MKKKHVKSTRRTGRLQSVTLCISTALVLILLGLVAFSTLGGRNLSALVKENLRVTMMLEQDMADNEAQTITRSLARRPYIKTIHFISKESALHDAAKQMGTDPSTFTDGVNPFSSSIELTLKSDYANNDSLAWITKELKKYPKVSDITYQKDLIDAVNRNLAKIGVAMIVLAILLTFVSFSLINNTVKLGIYARRFSIHTMKLVGASWGFIRRPFVWNAVLIGIIAAALACTALGFGMYALYRYEPEILTVITWREMAITGASVFFFGIVITVICANISVNRFLRMKAGDLYKI